MNKRIASLEGLRGIFILFIIIHHYYYIKFGNADLNSLPLGYVSVFRFLYLYGWIGVEYFFMLSGFGLAMKYNDKKIDRIEAFIWERLKRIWPIATIAEVLNALFYLKSISFTRLFRSIFFIQFGWEAADKKPYNGVTWFLDVLLICYILFFCMCKVKEVNENIYIVLVGAFCAIGGFCIYGNYELPLLFSWNGRGYLAFFGGVILGLCYKRIPESVIRKYSIFSVLLLIMVCVLCFCRGIEAIIGGIADFRFMLSACFMPNLIIVCSMNSLLKKVLSLNIFRLLGKISIYIFLFQPFYYLCLYSLDQKYMNIPFSRIRGLLFVIVSLCFFSFLVMKIHLKLINFFKKNVECKGKCNE